MNQGSVTVVGGVNMDIGGKPYQKLTLRDSNPGRVTFSPGGVGRNIAHNLALLGNRVRLISALGEDESAERIKKSCDALQIDISDCLILPEEATSTYLYILRDDGDMELAVSDMGIMERITADFLAEKMETINRSELLIVDSNIPHRAIAYLVRHAAVPVIAETVSRIKAEKFADVLSYLDLITPNVLEAEVLTGRPVDAGDKQSVVDAGNFLLQHGVKRVVITMGAQGAYFSDGEESGFYPPLPGNMVSGNGAGDALLSGTATGLLSGYGFAESVRLGMACAVITLESPGTNNAALRLSDALQRAGLTIE